MNKNNSSFVTEEENDDIVILRHQLQDETQESAFSIKRRFVQWFGRLSTLALGAATFAPNAFHIPSSFRPYIFVAFVLWVFAFFAGMFNS